MLATHRPQHPRNPHPPISYPLSPDDDTFHTDSLPFSPTPAPPPMSQKSHRGRRPSLNNPMSWLSRSTSNSSSSHSVSYAPALKPVRISEPTFAIDPYAYPRTRALGAGAVVVRTPQEALAGSGVTVDYTSDPEKERDSDIEESDEEDEDETLVAEKEKETPRTETPAIPPAYSPPRPTLPLSKSTPSLPMKPAVIPARPNRPPPPPPAASVPSVRSSIQKPSPSPPMSSYFPPVPPLPSHLASPTPPPPFECILLSPIPNNAIDVNKVIITLETCTATHRTTLNTLTSRPSHLADYLKLLFAKPFDSELAEPHSPTSEYSPSESTFNSIFHHHLTASGLLPGSASNVHIFLDRPSASYEHILAFLRSPPNTIDYVTPLPHAVRLYTYSTARVETLIALRDEARFLGLDELAWLCTEELLSRQAHTRGASGGSLRSMDTLRERDEEREPEPIAVQLPARDSVGSSGSGSMHSAMSEPRSGSLRDRPRPPSKEREWKDSVSLSGTIQSRQTGSTNWL